MLSILRLKQKKIGILDVHSTLDVVPGMYHNQCDSSWEYIFVCTYVLPTVRQTCSKLKMGSLAIATCKHEMMPYDPSCHQVAVCMKGLKKK